MSRLIASKNAYSLALNPKGYTCIAPAIQIVKISTLSFEAIPLYELLLSTMLPRVSERPMIYHNTGITAKELLVVNILAATRLGNAQSQHPKVTENRE